MKFAIALLPLLAAIADARHLPLRRHRADRQQQHFQHARNLEVALDERGLPITATTTVTVDMTSTQTVWVPPTPTGQVPFEPSASVSESNGGSVTSVWESASSSLSMSESALPTGSESSYSSELPATSASSSEWASSAIASASSSWASESYSSEMASSTAYPSASGSMSDYSSESTSASSQAPSASASASESVSSAPASEVTASLSASASVESYSASDAAPSSSSYTESLTEASASISSIASSSMSVSASANVTSSISASATSTSASLEASSTSSMWNETSASASSSAAASSSIRPSSTSASSSAVPSSTRLPNVPRTIMAGYYPDWSAWTLPPESVDFNRFDVVDFAFAIPTWDGRLEFTQDDSSDLLQRLSKLAHKAGKRVKLSIGGWTGSKYFSTLVADPALRKTFVNNCVQAYWAYGLDGIDIDWEYPNAAGAGGNAISPDDSANFLLYLAELRQALPSVAIITLATQVWPFAGIDQKPLEDVSAFAAIIDWIIIMNYDIWGSSDNPGPNAPLSDACGTSTQPLANAYASVASWTAAGMPPEKITLGVPAYGYLQKSRATALRTRDYIAPPADEIANLTSTFTSYDKRDIVTVRNGGGGDNNGQVGFADLVKQGALALDSQGKYIGAGGFYREWDACSSTPWIRSSHTGQVVTYDDPDSLSMKAQFARQSGLRGCNMFSMDGDWTGSNWPLVDALRSGMGI